MKLGERWAGRGAWAGAWVMMGMLCWSATARGAAPAAPVDPAEDLFSGQRVPRLRIDVPPEGVRVLEAYKQVWGQTRPERTNVWVTVRDGTQVYTNVAMHLKGSYTFQAFGEKPSLTLNFDKGVPGQRFHGLDKIHLNNSVQDRTYLCEKLARDLFREAGVPSSRVGHARVTVNGRDLGFYVLVEGYNKRFLKRHFASVKGNLYDGGSGGDVNKTLEVDAGDHREDRTDLKALAAAARDPNHEAAADRLAKLVDLERFRTFVALEVMLLHWDGYALGPNNYRLFQDASVGRFVFLPHGLDQILGKGMALSTPLAPKWDGMVARGLFRTSEGRRAYLDHVARVYTNHFQAPALLARVDRWAAALRSSGALPSDDRAMFDSEVNGLRTRIQRRADMVRQHIENPPKPLAVPAGEGLSLTGWQLNTGTRSGVTGRRMQGGREVLQVSITGGRWAAGSWRKMLFLGPGRYEIVGEARAVGLPADQTHGTNGVVLRLSGDVSMTGTTNATDWVTLRRELVMKGEAEEEVVLEFRGPVGAGEFRGDTLRVRRLSP